jgi:predicted nuclease of predicted toxin-antitoxin system
MKLLLDSCVWGGTRAELEAAGHDVVWAGDWAEDPGDDEILATANREGRVLVTLDKDFGELAIVRGRPHAGILRLVNVAARQQATICLHTLNLYQAELSAGSVLTVERNRIRIRPPTIDTQDGH